MVRSGLHFRWVRRTPNEADDGDKHEAELGRQDCLIDDLCGGKHQPYGTAMRQEFRRVLKSTHRPRMSVGAYFWGRGSEQRATGQLRASHCAQATQEVPLPSMRSIDTKNQPTAINEKSTGSREKVHGNSMNGRTRCHEHIIQPHLQSR
jgi:hypothetical protein